MKYLLKFTNKRDLRLLFRYNYEQQIACSSLYTIDDFYYVLLNASHLIRFPDYISLQQITDKSNAEQYLFDWASSEIIQSIDYIKFEQESVLAKNSRSYAHLSVVVSRCFEPLADIFAILNFTPDSFSDGGKFNNVDSALQRIRYHCQIGAKIIDLGVEATNPGVVSALAAEEEIKLLKQILPEVLQLKEELNFELSIDTYHVETVTWLLNFAVDIINDVSGSLPLYLIKQILDSNRRYVAMHSLSLPANVNHMLDINIPPLEYLSKWQDDKIRSIQDSGCEIHNLIIDPGIGFGINPVQSWYVVRHLAKLRNIPCEFLLGHSRKVFYSHITDKVGAKRDLATAVVAASALPHVDYIRIHDLDLFNQITPVFNQLG